MQRWSKNNRFRDNLQALLVLLISISLFIQLEVILEMMCDLGRPQ